MNDDIPTYPDPGPAPPLEEMNLTRDELQARTADMTTAELRERVDKLSGLREHSDDYSYDHRWQVLARRYAREELARREGQR